MNSVIFSALPFLTVVVIMAIVQITYAKGIAPSPAPAAPSNDGSAIDQGIAYVLLVVALAITYLVH